MLVQSAWCVKNQLKSKFLPKEYWPNIARHMCPMHQIIDKLGCYQDLYDNMGIDLASLIEPNW